MFWIIKKSKRQKGFTFIELMLVVSMIAMLSAMTIPISFGSLKKQSVEEEASQLLSVLRQTQAKSMKGRDDSLWGVYFTPETYTSFKGNSYEERDPLYDEVFELYSDISIAGVSEIVFDNSGKPQIEGLVGHWTMNEGEGGVVHDLSSNSNHGVLVNGPSWVDGKIGGALDFDGVSNYVDCGNGVSLNTYDFLSAEIWVYQDSLPSGQNGIVEKGITQGYTGWALFQQSNLYYFIAAKTDGNLVRVSIPAVKGQWVHLVAVKDSSKIYLYKNGVLASSADFPTAIKSNGLTAKIGKYAYWQDSNIFNGLIDDVRIYNRALSPEEIRLIYESGLDGVDDNIIELSDGSDSVKINVGRQGRIEVVR